MLALTALEQWYITGLDVKSAFLYGKLDEELYMEQPEGFKLKGQETKVLHLKCVFYGLKQAALAWWRALDKSMEGIGYKRLLSDSGLFVHTWECHAMLQWGVSYNMQVSGCEVISGLQFRDAQVLTKQGSKSM